MAQNKFLTIDLATGKKVLKNLEAALVKFDPSGLNGISGTNLQEALKQEVTRALAAEGALNESIQNAIEAAETADAAIKALIGAIPEQSTVKAELDRIEGLVTSLTSKVDSHIGNSTIHITDEERTKWNKVVSDLATEVSERQAADSALDTKISGKADAVHSHVMADITDLADALALKADVATVNEELAKKVEKTEILSNGKIKTELLPSIAINNTTVVRTAEEAMSAQIENGDIIIINPEPDAVTLAEENLPTSGTFICVDILAETFAERFRRLYSNSDAVNKAEVQQMVDTEKERALAAESALGQRIDDEKNELTSGSLANKIKVNADAIAAEVSARQEKDTELQGAIEAEVTRAKGEEARIEGLITAEQTAREEADRTINSNIEELTQKVNKIQSQEEFTIAINSAGIAVGDLLTIKTEDGSIVKATLDDDNVAGIAVEVQESDVKVAIMGKVDVSGFKVLVPGRVYYLGNDGTITDVCPQSSGQHIIKIGKALSTTELFVNIEDAIEIL